MTRPFIVHWTDGTTSGQHRIWATSVAEAQAKFYLEFKLRAIVNITY